MGFLDDLKNASKSNSSSNLSSRELYKEIIKKPVPDEIVKAVAESIVPFFKQELQDKVKNNIISYDSDYSKLFRKYVKSNFRYEAFRVLDVDVTERKKRSDEQKNPFNKCDSRNLNNVDTKDRYCDWCPKNNYYIGGRDFNDTDDELILCCYTEKHLDQLLVLIKSMFEREKLTAVIRKDYDAYDSPHKVIIRVYVPCDSNGLIK
jgi:hypothetical protein